MGNAILWDYPKSSASYRVRIALNLAGIAFQSHMVNLLEGEQRSAEHLARNPQGFVPVLDIDGHRFTQSLAIIEYLNTTRSLGLLPDNPLERARAQALAHTVAVDVHPVCNASVATYATGGMEPKRTEWMRRFIRPGLEAFEAHLAEFEQTPFCIGETPSLADLCLMPQLYNARRWSVEFEDLPRLARVEDACKKHEAFALAMPGA